MLFLRQYTLKRNVVHAGDAEKGRQATEVAEHNPSDLPLNPAAGDDEDAAAAEGTSISREDTRTIAGGEEVKGTVIEKQP